MSDQKAPEKKTNYIPGGYEDSTFSDDDDDFDWVGKQVSTKSDWDWDDAGAAGESSSVNLQKPIEGGGGSGRDYVDPNLYKLPIPIEQVYFIDTNIKVKKFLDAMLNKQRLNPHLKLAVGVDCEWRPATELGETNKNHVAIMQIAQRDRVHIIDIFTLRPNINKIWEYCLNKNILQNENILKVFYGVSSDLHELEKLSDAWSDLRYEMKCALDLLPLSQDILENHKDFYPFIKEDGKIKGGLVELTRACLGKVLSKGEQMSNWEKRPLDAEQLEYGASDAYCLLDLFLFFFERCEKLGIDFIELIKKHFYKPPKRKQQKPKNPA